MHNEDKNWSIGLDYLSVSLFVDWDSKKHVELLQTLNKAKNEANEKGESAMVDIEGITVEVRASGIRTGDQFWSFTFRAFGCFFSMTTVDKAGDHRANLRVEAKGEVFAQYESSSVWRGVEKFVHKIGGGVIRHAVIGRIDIAADLPGESPAQFADIWHQGKVTTRARSNVCYRDGNNKVTGLQWGRSPILCRIYDKIAEMKERPNVNKQEALEKKWGGPQDEVLRIEFQLRRDALRSFKVTTWADWQQKASVIVRYLSEKWIVLYADDDKFDRKNPTRNRRHQLWRKFTEEIQAYYGEAGAEEVARVTRGGSALDLKRASAMIRGWCAHIAAHLGTYHIGTAIQEFSQILNDGINQKGVGWWADRIDRLMALDRLKTAEQLEELACDGAPYFAIE